MRKPIARRKMAVTQTQTKMHTYCILHAALQRYSNMCSNMHVETALKRPKADIDKVALAHVQPPDITEVEEKTRRYTCMRKCTKCRHTKY